MVNNEIIVLVGFSGAGKDTFAEMLGNHNYKFVTSHTTRPMRDNESEGNPYKFTNKSTMIDKIIKSEFIEYRMYDTFFNNKKDVWYYGTHKDEISDDEKYVCVLDIIGLNEFKKYFGNRVKGIFIDVPDSVREERAKNRGSFDKQEWERRLQDDRDNFSISKIVKSTDYIVENLDKSEAIKEIKDILNISNKKD